jgi:phosphohistidine phosphatase
MNVDTESKILVLVRHAKAASPYGDYKDIERPLTKQGLDEAKDMADWLHEKFAKTTNIFPLFISSTAVRTQETAHIFLTRFRDCQETLQLQSLLYNPQEDSFYQVIQNIADSINTLFIFSHNNGITDFVNSLTHNRIDVIPTCGVVVLRVKDDSWKNFRTTIKEWLWFKAPGLPG